MDYGLFIVIIKDQLLSMLLLMDLHQVMAGLLLIIIKG